MNRFMICVISFDYTSLNIFQNIFGQVIRIIREIGISLTCLQSENHNPLVLGIR